MARPSKRKQSIRNVVQERENQRKIRKRQLQGENRKNGSESSDEEEDVLAVGLVIQGSANSAFDESDDDEDDDVWVSEGEEVQQANESAFARLMASAVTQSRCVWSPLSSQSLDVETNCLFV
jgi:hypothetical protein